MKAMSNLARRPSSRLTRKQREQRAYALVMAGGAAGLLTVASVVTLVLGITSFGWTVLLAAITIVCVLLFRRTVGGK
jgi:hypothetical protein